MALVLQASPDEVRINRASALCGLAEPAWRESRLTLRCESTVFSEALTRVHCAVADRRADGLRGGDPFVDPLSG